MGRNAQARRDTKAALQLVKPAHRRVAVEDTKTIRRLREKMREVQTLAQFERIVSATSPERRRRLRRLLEPMLLAGLPCCGPQKLADAMKRPLDPDSHGKYCPTRPRLVLTDADAG